MQNNKNNVAPQGAGAAPSGLATEQGGISRRRAVFLSAFPLNALPRRFRRG